MAHAGIPCLGFKALEERRRQRNFEQTNTGPGYCWNLDPFCTPLLGLSK